MTLTLSDGWQKRTSSKGDPGCPCGYGYGYGYDDPAGRLSSVQDSTAGLCTTRAYGFDSRSNRTGMASTTVAEVDGPCAAPQIPTVSSSRFDRLDRPVTVTNSLGGTQTSGYDQTVEPRGMLTGVVDSQAGSWTARYDPDGQLTTAALPGGLSLSQHSDPTGSPQRRTYTRGTGPDLVTVLEDTVTETIHGQWASHSGVSSQSFGYDPAGRLSIVQDTTGGLCTTRAYGFDFHSNRTGLASTTVAELDGPCAAPPIPAVSSSYDSSDRLVAAGTGYDLFGRTTTLGDLTLGFYSNDLVASQQNASRRQSWSLDPNLRFRAATVDTTNGAGGWNPERTSLNHYDDDSDSPSHITDTTTNADGTSSTVTTRFTGSTDGTLLETRLDRPTPGTTLALTNLHGDITIRFDVADPSSTAVVTDADEYGNPRTGQTPNRYGWLGGKQRSTDSLGGLTLMGVRLYNPTTGRFLSTDPIPQGPGKVDLAVIEAVGGRDSGVG